MRKIFTDRFATKTRDEWTSVFAGTDACVTPVLTWAEAAANEHLRARSTLPRRRHSGSTGTPVSRTPPGPVAGPPSATTPLTEINWAAQ
jgi:alpha-methylacyl-CoA racemase